MRRNIQKIIAIFTSVMISLSMIVLPVNAEEDIRVFLDGQKISFDVPPQIINDYTMVPMRAIFEALGYYVDWNDADKSITAVNGSNTIFMKLLSNEMTYNEDVITLDIAPMSIDGRTLVPVRAISETSGYNVSWDGANRAVMIGDVSAVSYYDATKEIEQINSLMEQGLYLEAIDCCDQTISWHTLSDDDNAIIYSLKVQAETRYKDYSKTKIIVNDANLSRTTIINARNNLDIPEDMAVDVYTGTWYWSAANQSMNAISIHKSNSDIELAFCEALGDDGELLMKFSKYDDEKNKMADEDIKNKEDGSYVDITRYVEQLNAYMDSGLYLEAIQLSQDMLDSYNMSPSDYNLVSNIYMTAQSNYNEFLEQQTNTIFAKVTEYYKQGMYNEAKDELTWINYSSLNEEQKKIYQKYKKYIDTAIYYLKPIPYVGMQKEDIVNSRWGRPNRINTWYTYDGVHEQWCYYNDSVYHYKFVYVTNGVVTSVSTILE